MPPGPPGNSAGIKLDLEDFTRIGKRVKQVSDAAVALGQRESVDILGTDYPTPDGTCIRDYIHVLDLAQAHILALKSETSERYNLGTGGGTSVKEVIAACREITGKDIPALEKPRRVGDPPRLIAASEKIRAGLGWQPKFQDIRAIVESAWAWHVKNPGGYGN